MTHAVNQINADPNILANHTLNFIYADNNDNAFTSVDAFTKLWKEGAVAFIGPEDFCETEARIAASWNLPIISYVSKTAQGDMQSLIQVLFNETLT